MARCTKEKALETRERILDAAEDVFDAKGVSNTSLADVAAAAGVTRGAVYWHFTNKADLFDAMCQRIRLPMETIIEAAADVSIADPLGQLRVACRFLFRETVENPHHNKVLDILIHKCEFVDPTDPIFIRQQEWMRQCAINNTLLLSNAIAKGQLPATLDVRLASVMLHSMISGLLSTWLFAPDSFNLIQDGEEIIDAYLETLLTTRTLNPGTDTVHTALPSTARMTR
ncbi:MAG: TetR family transcriptional regulator [Glaciimonas sp.]|nr:TetR family transcriptional regulator [Glaciimonas sp.]